MKKFLLNMLVIIYFIFAIFITVCLLSTNENGITEFGNYSFIVINNNKIKGDFSKGALVIADKSEEPQKGEKLFYYNAAKNNEVALEDVVDKEEGTDSTVYILGENKRVQDQYIIGSVEHAKAFNNLGTILSIFESRWGFLFLVILPSLLAFFYEIIKIFESVRNSPKQGTN